MVLFGDQESDESDDRLDTMMQLSNNDLAEQIKD